MMDALWWDVKKTIATANELGSKRFGRLLLDISAAVRRNDLEYLAQFDFLRTSDPEPAVAADDDAEECIVRHVGDDECATDEIREECDAEEL